MYKLFVGNKTDHIFYTDHWVRKFYPITLNSIVKHLKHEITIGSYPIYVEEGISYAKWVCIDIDAHERIPPEYRKEIKAKYDKKVARGVLRKLEREYKKRTDEELKSKQEEFVKYLYDNLYELVWISNDYCVLEDSVGGFHLWIFLKEKTKLIDAGKLISVLKEVIDPLYKQMIDGEEMPEYYPKQYSLDYLDKKCGNGVRIPLGYNLGKKGASKIIKGNLNKVKRFDPKGLIKNVTIEELEKNNGTSCSARELYVYSPQEVAEELDFYLQFPIRPCFRRIITGETQCRDEHGHYMRMALVQELNNIKMPIELMVKCFENQDDFDEELTLIGIKSTLNGSNIRDGRYSCKKIKELGYCHECKKNGNFTRWKNVYF